MESSRTVLKYRSIVLAAAVQVAAAFLACGGGGPSAVEGPRMPVPYPRPAYQHLSETGLFGALVPRAVIPEALAFEPGYKLWSDGADKRRWVRLPPGTQIDTSDMDHWVFPIGTKFWKEFSRDGTLLETRLIERYGSGPEDYWMGAFVWSDDQTDAVFALGGQKDIAGTMHDAPAQKDCDVCHRGEPGRVLGFSAIQLSATTTAPTVSSLNAAGLISHRAPEGGYPVPGAAADEQAPALGYLHANCGHCHNSNGSAWHDTQMALRLRVGQGEANGQAITGEVCNSIIGGKVQYWRGGAITMRVAPGQPDASALVVRMQVRGTDDQMPPLASEVVDQTGLGLLRRWIATLPP